MSRQPISVPEPRPFHSKFLRFEQQRRRDEERARLGGFIDGAAFDRFADITIRRALVERFWHNVSDSGTDADAQQESDAQRKELSQTVWALAQVARRRAKLQVPKEATKTKQLRKAALLCRSLLDVPFFNPTFADGDFSQSHFWLLPVLLDAYADVVDKAATVIRRMSRSDSYRNALLIHVGIQARQCFGKYNWPEIARMLSQCGYSTEAKTLEQAHLRAVKNFRKTLT